MLSYRRKRKIFSLVAFAQEAAQGELFAMNTMVLGQVHGTQPKHSGQVMLGTTLAKCTRCKGVCKYCR